MSDKNEKRIDKLNSKNDEIEDSTKYGEFISSFFSWNTLEGKKEKAKYLENITRDKCKKREKKKNKEK